MQVVQTFISRIIDKNKRNRNGNKACEREWMRFVCIQGKEGDEEDEKKCEMHVDEQLNDGNGFLQGKKFMILARLMEL